MITNMNNFFIKGLGDILIRSNVHKTTILVLQEYKTIPLYQGISFNARRNYQKAPKPKLKRENNLENSVTESGKTSNIVQAQTVENKTSYHTKNRKSETESALIPYNNVAKTENDQKVKSMSTQQNNSREKSEAVKESMSVKTKENVEDNNNKEGTGKKPQFSSYNKQKNNENDQFPSDLAEINYNSGQKMPSNRRMMDEDDEEFQMNYSNRNEVKFKTNRRHDVSDQGPVSYNRQTYINEGPLMEENIRRKKTFFQEDNERQWRNNVPDTRYERMMEAQEREYPEQPMSIAKGDSFYDTRQVQLKRRRIRSVENIPAMNINDRCWSETGPKRRYEYLNGPQPYDETQIEDEPIEPMHHRQKQLPVPRVEPDLQNRISLDNLTEVKICNYLYESYSDPQESSARKRKELLKGDTEKPKKILFLEQTKRKCSVCKRAMKVKDWLKLRKLTLT